MGPLHLSLLGHNQSAGGLHRLPTDSSWRAGGSLSLPTPSLSCRVVPASATSTPARSMMEGALTYGRAGSQVTVEPTLRRAPAREAEAILRKQRGGAQRQRRSNERRGEAAGGAGRATSEPVAEIRRQLGASPRIIIHQLLAQQARMIYLICPPSPLSTSHIQLLVTEDVIERGLHSTQSSSERERKRCFAEECSLHSH